MANRNFSTWLSGFRDSIADYGYYIDFEKVHRNVDGIKVELNILNSLIGSKNIKEDFKALIKKYPETLKCIPLLLAVRANEIYCQDENGGYMYQFYFGKYPPNSHAHYERYAYVIMLYGNSSLGKTELVKEISQKFFGSKCLEKHLSMFKNNNYSEYFFGDAPNRKSLGFDLLERESNLIFFDELDKCPEHFFSAFYTLFDNTLFKDATYDADVSSIVIILTSNYQTEDEMKKQLGLPIFYRIDKMIHFDDFGCDTIYAIVKSEIEARKSEYSDKLTPEMVYAAVSPLVSATGENARTIKYKVQQVIEELLFQEVVEKMTKN